jgi:hypothetical protein
LSSPATAECSIENDIVVLEVIIYCATLTTLEGCSGRTPRRRIRGVAAYASRHVTAGKEPYVDNVAGPFHSVDAAAAIVEPVTEGVRAASLHAAACASLAALVDHGAAGAAVHGDCVLGLVADAFNDIDFAVIGP